MFSSCTESHIYRKTEIISVVLEVEAGFDDLDYGRDQVAAGPAPDRSADEPPSG